MRNIKLKWGWKISNKPIYFSFITFLHVTETSSCNKSILNWKLKIFHNLDHRQKCLNLARGLLTKFFELKHPTFSSPLTESDTTLSQAISLTPRVFRPSLRHPTMLLRDTPSFVFLCEAVTPNLGALRISAFTPAFLAHYIPPFPLSSPWSPSLILRPLFLKLFMTLFSPCTPLSPCYYLPPTPLPLILLKFFVPLVTPCSLLPQWPIPSLSHVWQTFYPPILPLPSAPSWTLEQHLYFISHYDAWSIKNAFMGPILFGDLRLLTDTYTITFVFKLQYVIC